MRKPIVVTALLLASCGAVLAVALNAQDGDYQGTFSIGFASYQQGSPIVIEGTTSDLTLLYRDVRVRNSATREITALDFAVMEHPVGTSSVGPKMRKFGRISMPIAPGATVVLHPDGIVRSDIQDIVRYFNGMSVYGELGVLRVEFADHSVWNYSAGGNGFREVSAKTPFAAAVPCSATATGGQYGIIRASIRSVRVALRQPTFTCGPSTSCIYCTNNLTSCTNNICGNGQDCVQGNCPKQVCVVQ